MSERSQLLTPIINNAGIKSAAIECPLIHKQTRGPAECEPDRYKGILWVCHVWVSSGQYSWFREYNY